MPISIIANLPCNEPCQDKERTDLEASFRNRFFFWIDTATAVNHKDSLQGILMVGAWLVTVVFLH